MSFEFMAVVRNEGADSSIYRLKVDDELREEMARTFTIPAEKWLEPEMARVPFNEEYRLSDRELFEIKQFALPPDTLNAVRFPQEYSEFDATSRGIADLKAVFAIGDQRGRLTAMFKTIGKAKKIQPAKNLMLVCANKSFARQAEPGFVLDDRICALYMDGGLLFRSPSTVKQIVNLKPYMKQANDLEVVEMLESWFETDADKVLAVADTWMRKRFSALKDSKLFEQRDPVDIYETARSFSAEIPLQLSKDRKKLVMPGEKRDIRMVLKFLNEEYYRGELTGKVYQTPSKRPLEKAENLSGGSRKAPLNFDR